MRFHKSYATGNQIGGAKTKTNSFFLWLLVWVIGGYVVTSVGAQIALVAVGFG